MKKLINLIKPSAEIKSSTERGQFLSVGFHGDLYLLELVEKVMADSTVFIETGSNLGSTLAYVAKKYSHLHCLSCEPDAEAFFAAVQNTKQLANVFIFNEDSQQFLGYMLRRFPDILSSKPAFWLDAHGYGFDWPLRDEIAFITSNFESANILVDDFLVPGMDIFKYDRHGDQVCSLDYIKPSMKTGQQYDIYYPSYTERTSKHHPLCGWGLISYGDGKLSEIPSALNGKVRVERLAL